jgi:hypothetical protein
MSTYNALRQGMNMAVKKIKGDCMKIQELRIGNLVQDKHGNTELVTQLILTGDVTRINGQHDYGLYLPVKLTHLWALKLGFEFDMLFDVDPPIYYRPGSSFYLCSKTLQPLNGGFPIAEYEIEYVHQLQNLHYVLTGEELAVKYL